AGAQGGARAAAIGYGRRIGDRATFSLGGAFSGGEKSVNAGFGFDL
ncbi:MAG TPA: YadA-like family protein, partial [Luteimonas sp.]|nr:YadA-like family protein [Luteimonas sp.]